MPFFIGAGQAPDTKLNSGVIALSKFWGGELIELSCFEPPAQILNALPNKEGLAHLKGDAALAHSNGSSWLEALGAWRQPTVLMVMPLISGDIPGLAAAYVALCKELRVPLLGVLQVGGQWNRNQRINDGLPWCGWIPLEVELESKAKKKDDFENCLGNHEFIFEEVKATLLRRSYTLGL